MHISTFKRSERVDISTLKISTLKRSERVDIAGATLGPMACLCLWDPHKWCPAEYRT